MSIVKSGDTVLVHYTGTLDDGQIFDSSVERGEPLQFTVGSGQVITGFDSGVTGMTVGETRKIHIASEDAYGDHTEENMISVPLEHLPKDIPLLPGTPLNMQTPEGHVLQVAVHEVQGETVIIDANHPLAGKALNFELELVQIL
jgi:FKBP-type peptidyl-prolyl cis-trans isomerase 2